MPGRVPASLRSLGLPHAAFFPENGAVQPVHLLAKLVRQAGRVGVQWYTGARVTAWTVQDGAGIRLTVGGNHVRVERVVLYTGLTPVVRPTRVRCRPPVPWPRTTHIPWTPTLDTCTGVPARTDPWCSEGGAISTSTPRRPTCWFQVPAFKTLAARWPGGAVAVTDRWAGIMGFTPDHLPLVGPVAPGLCVTGGFSGHGVAMVDAAGDLLTQQLLSAPTSAVAGPCPLLCPGLTQ